MLWLYCRDGHRGATSGAHYCSAAGGSRAAAGGAAGSCRAGRTGAAGGAGADACYTYRHCWWRWCC
eukprot:6090238-Pyramimonas_sp.AAC.1